MKKNILCHHIHICFMPTSILGEFQGTFAPLLRETIKSFDTSCKCSKMCIFTVFIITVLISLQSCEL